MIFLKKKKQNSYPSPSFDSTIGAKKKILFLDPHDVQGSMCKNSLCSVCPLHCTNNKTKDFEEGVERVRESTIKSKFSW